MPTLNCVGGGATASKALQQPAAGEKLANGRNVAAATARIDSPDNDSAFSDNGSMLSSESSASSGTNGSRKTGHQNQQQPPPPPTSSSSADSSSSAASEASKADQINLALQKLQDTAVTLGGGGTKDQQQRQQLFVKIFCADGTTKSVLVDEVMSVGTVLEILVEKNHVQLEPSWGIVEHIPELYMERCLEDHESLLSVLYTWRPEAKNKLLFVPRSERYDLFRRPEKYLLGTSSKSIQRWDQQARQALLQEFFYSTSPSSESPSSIQVPEIEGPLWLKSEGKKNWKKYYFVLRPTGLYHTTKPGGKLKSKDLVCLASFEGCLVYLGVGWKKKYKSPTEFGFALKPPGVQVKTAKQICYLCAESEAVLYQWTTAVRIVRSRHRLLENYNRLLAKMQTGIGKECLYAQMRREQEQDETVIGQPAEQQAPTAAGCVYSPNHSSSSSSSSSAMHLSSNSSNSVPSSSNASVSSGCISETSSVTGAGENGFDADYPDGGTIKRKPQQQAIAKNELIEVSNTIRRRCAANTVSGEPEKAVKESSLPPPPPEVLQQQLQQQQQQQQHAMAIKPVLYPPPPAAAATEPEMNGALAGSDLSLNSLPPPPEELKVPLRYPLQALPQQTYGVNQVNGNQSAQHPPPLPPSALDSTLSHLQVQQQQVSRPAPLYGVNHCEQGGAQTPETVYPTREPLYPCGVFRSVFPNKPEGVEAAAGFLPPPPPPAQMVVQSAKQMELLKQMPNNAPLQKLSNGGSMAMARLNAAATSNSNPYQQQVIQPLPEVAAGFRKKRITFNELVENVEDRTTSPLKFSPENPTSPPIGGENMYGGSHMMSRVPQNHWNFPSSTVRNPNPGRLFESSESTTAKETPPREFLNDLQRVMQKKWTVAQRFHAAAAAKSQSSANHSQLQQEAADSAELAERFANHYNERDVSKWIMQSLKHCHIRETDMTQDLYDMKPQLHQQQQQSQQLLPLLKRPKIYNGRSVPNCFPPTSKEAMPLVGNVNVSGLPDPQRPAAAALAVAAATLTKAINAQEQQKVIQMQFHQQHQHLMQQQQLQQEHQLLIQQQNLYGIVQQGQMIMSNQGGGLLPNQHPQRQDICSRHIQAMPPLATVCLSPPPMILNPLDAPMQMSTSPQMMSPQHQQLSLNLSSPTSRPVPPRRSDTTQLTSPR